MKMKAARLYGKNDLRVTECAVPEINENEILLKIRSAAVCGTDLRMIANGYSGVDEEHPLILGHELSGEIEKCGKYVEGYQPGDRIAVAPNFGCGICGPCISGNTHLCASYQAFGINMDGAFAEYMKIPETAIRQGNLLKMSSDLSYDAGAVLEPASCVLNGQQQAGIRLGDCVLVIGAGPIGLMHGMLARAGGAGQVFITDLNKERLKLCTEAQKDIIPIEQENLKEEIDRYTNGRGMDVVIVACPSGEAQAQSLHYLGMNGRALFFGGLPAGRDQVVLDSNLIHYKQLRICGSTRASLEQYRTVARLQAAGRIDLNRTITGRYGIEEIWTAVEDIKQGKVLKAVINFE